MRRYRLRSILQCGCRTRHTLRPCISRWQHHSGSSADIAQDISKIASTTTSSEISAPLKVAIIGRPNVGKSTLFNRLTGGTAKLQKYSGGAALVTSIPGTTRDCKETLCNYAGYRMRVVDTGGLVEEHEILEDETAALGDETNLHDVTASRGVLGRVIRPPRGEPSYALKLQRLINNHVEREIREADVVLFLLDARAGVGPEELHYGSWLHDMGARSRTLLVANKVEGGVLNETMQDAIYEAYRMGHGDPIPISAAHNEGMTDLLSSVLQVAQQHGKPLTQHIQGKETSGDDKSMEGPQQTSVAVVGMPNVGKSTLINALIRETRLLTSDVPGTTRDTVMVEYEWTGGKVKLIDTAGIRKKGRRDESTPLENLAVDEALRAVRFAQVVVLVLDGQQLRLRRQEQVIAETAYRLAPEAVPMYYDREGRAIVIAANKSDLLEDSRRAYAEGVRNQLKLLCPQLGDVPIIATCAVTGQGVGSLLPAVSKVFRAWTSRINTSLLNRWLADVIYIQEPPRGPRNRVTKLKYITQVKSRPPTFTLFTNTRDLADSYQRFLKNNLQEELRLHGMDVRMNVRSTSEKNPFAPEKRQGQSEVISGQAAHQREEGRRLINVPQKMRASQGGLRPLKPDAAQGKPNLLMGKRSKQGGVVRGRKRMDRLIERRQEKAEAARKAERHGKAVPQKPFRRKVPLPQNPSKRNARA